MKKLRLLIFILPLFIALQFCSTAKKATETPRITYVANIEPVMKSSCTPCHFPPNGKKMPLNNYDSVKSVIDDIIVRIQKEPSEKGFMPMKHPKLPDSTINLFIQWKSDGLKEN